MGVRPERVHQGGGSQEQAIKRALAGIDLGGADAATYKEALEVLGVVFEEDAV